MFYLRLHPEEIQSILQNDLRDEHNVEQLNKA